MTTNNSNSYISIKLPDTLKDMLYDYAINVNKNNPTFKIMNKECLHMTFIFVGANKSYKEAQRINNIVETYNNNDKCYDFQSVCEELFPPTKENLLVIKFKTSNMVITIRKQLMKELNINDNGEFVPHVTLGKFVGKKEKRNLPKIEDVNFESNSLIFNNPYHLI